MLIGVYLFSPDSDELFSQDSISFDCIYELAAQYPLSCPCEGNALNYFSTISDAFRIFLSAIEWMRPIDMHMLTQRSPLLDADEG